MLVEGIVGLVGALSVVGGAVAWGSSRSSRRRRALEAGESVPPASGMRAKEEGVAPLPTLHYEEDGHGTEREEKSVTLATIPVLYDMEAIEEEPTNVPGFSLASAARTDTGKKRQRNEDSYAFCGDLNLFVVADGMGGHRGGDVASGLAVQVIEGAFKKNSFDGRTHASIPKRASKIARAIQMANRSIRHLAQARAEFSDMGTTVVAALFSPEKRRLYVGHVGDSRCYRLREGQLEQLTSDHTLGSLGVSGPSAGNLARAVGSSQRVLSDVVIAEPKIGDTYLLCSDGLPKMVGDETIQRVLTDVPDETKAVDGLIQLANERGGVDNVTAIVIRVLSPTIGSQQMQTA